MNTTEYNREINNTHEINEYIGVSHQEQFNEFCDRDNKFLLLSGDTGNGKTQALINYAKQRPSLMISLLCPTQTLVNNLSLSNPEIPAGYGVDFYKEHKEKNFVITTYDTGLLFENRDIEAIDESHLLPPHSDFRAVIIKLLQTNTKKILISATPEVIIDLPYFRNQGSMIAFNLNKKVKDIKIFNTRKRSRTIISDIISGSKESTDTILIRVNNKDVILDMVAQYHNNLNGKKIGYLYSSKSEEAKYLTKYQDKTDLDNLRHGIIKDLDIVLCTSILDAGITLQSDKDIQAYAISHDTREMPNLVEVTQFYDRRRRYSKFDMSLTIVGSFCSYQDLRAEIPNFDNITQMCEVMSTNYSYLAKLREEDYKAMLVKYKLNPIVIDSLGFDSVEGASAVSRISNSTIITNFHNFPQYSTIHNTYVQNGKADQIKYIKGDKFINSSKEDIRVSKGARIITYCESKNIHLSLIIDNNKYYDKTYNVLKYVVDNYNTNSTDTFSNLVRGISYNTDSTFNFKELKLDNLIKTESQTIKALFDMIYKRGNFRGKSAKKVFKEGVNEDSEIVRFISLLTNK